MEGDDEMAEQKYDIGMVGLGVMGRNLLLNMADHDYSVAGYDQDTEKVEALRKEAGDRDIRGAESMEEFIGALRKPRSVMMLVPAGPPVDSVIRGVLPHLGAGDLVIDGGNSYFEDTNIRNQALAEKDIQYLGVGISGGSHGARYGPSMMPGGSKEAYERVQPIFEATAAKVDGEPCVTYLGPGSAGHYVKMVHNGIEYGLMQLIAETYDLMKRGMGLSDDEMGEVYDGWNGTELNGYLVEITSHIFRKLDETTGKRLIDVILDEAKQKGTGMWTSQDSLKLQVPTPTTDVAVVMRNLSVFEDEREAASKVLGGPPRKFEPAGDRETFLEQLRRALYAGMILTYTQGMALLRKASQEYEYGLHLEEVARIWRGGCIIRAALLEEIRRAFHKRPDIHNLLLDPDLGRKVKERQSDLRSVVGMATEFGIPAPGLMVSLGYFDGYRSAWLPANLIQAQRDYFGSHTYERVDARGFFHTQWEKE
jgi:6-phosphogluconate dehydrogenase